MTTHALFHVPGPVNEPNLSYAPGSPERAELRARLEQIKTERADIPCIIGGEDVRGSSPYQAVMPHKHAHVLADVHRGGTKEVEQAIAASAEAWPEWSRTPFADRAAIFLRAAELLAGPWRQRLNAATMLNLSKTAHQAEIDSACELIDFLRFNPYFLERIYEEQPQSAPGVWNRMEYRPLEGFVLAVTPFNFTSIAGNLPTSPAMAGNTVVWKPASSAALSAFMLMQLLEEAGLPDGVINLVFADGASVSKAALTNPELAGVHFTGSTAVFQSMWRTIGGQIERYKNYPRIVGETGGKDFILAHASANPDALFTQVLRGSFEYQGQKCSASSRLYVASNLWPELRERFAAELPQIKMGDVSDFENFMGAVIDHSSFDDLSRAIDEAKAAPEMEIVAGGDCDASVGWFIEPTLIETKDPLVRHMREELFGPVLTVYPYDERRWAETLELVDSSSPYALTGSIFASDRGAVAEAERTLRHAAGNFYVNDKPTGAIVGQQPFGGARASGTNDKAGSMWNLIRWVSPRALKETLVPPTDYRYPFMAADE
ncbi:MAG: L-glutamate gamma-semialdehyde dehydrogenase [Gaiellaceae bacterium]|jgi:1-pyrroline-5-carboxylate dehydrogenase